MAEKGCEIAIVSHPVDADICQLVVADTRLALGHLGAYRRKKNSQLKVIALTGSSGKTTTKEMLGSILSRIAPTLITRGNLNNDLGVPMMLLELRSEHQYAVMELGASHQGEIDYTSDLVQPHVAGILNIGTAHLGECGSDFKKIAVNVGCYCFGFLGPFFLLRHLHHPQSCQRSFHVSVFGYIVL